MKYALEGIKVLDLSQHFAVPGAGMYLGDQGADVIKVEPPWGDEGRRILTTAPIQMRNGSTLARSFLPLNRNKRGIVVDIQTDKGKEIVYKLARWADIMLQNYRPAFCRRCKLDYGTMQKINPRLIYLVFSPYGLKGPDKDLPGYDRVAQALSGIHGRRRLADGTPLAAGAWIADMANPILTAYGVTLALFMREKTGKGQKVELALLGAALAMQNSELVRAEKEKASVLRSHADQATYAPYMCQDRQWIITIIVADREWQRFCKVLGIEHLATAPDFATHLKRAENSDTLFQILTGIFSTKPRDEWLKSLREADLPCAPILSPEEAFDYPQTVENDLIVEVDDPRIGKVKMMGIPIRLSEAPGAIRRLAPDLGEHTEEILLKLGYKKDEIEQLRQEKVIM